MNQSVISSPIVRRRRSSAEVAALLSTFEQSGQSMRDFCRLHQMSVSSFSSLYRRHAGKHSSATALPAGAQRLPFQERTLLKGHEAVAQAKHSNHPLEVQPVGGVADGKQLWFKPNDDTGWV